MVNFAKYDNIFTARFEKYCIVIHFITITTITNTWLERLAMANTWLETFKREAGIRRCVILSGNTLDVYKLDMHYVPIQNVVIETLKSIGFTDVVLWDRFSGAKNITHNR